MKVFLLGMNSPCTFSLLVENAHYQGHTLSSHLAAIYDQHKRSWWKACDQGLNEREVVLFDRNRLVFEKALERGNAALALDCTGNFGGNVGQLSLLATDDPTDHSDQGIQMACFVAFQVGAELR